MLEVLADENIILLDELFAPFAKVTKKEASKITASALVDIDVLLIRSVTKVDAKLLEKANKLKFVATATVGIDHLDIRLLNKKKIHYTSTPKSNSLAVVQYVLSAFAYLQLNFKENLQKSTIAIIGLGNIGFKLVEILSCLNINILIVDPIKKNLNHEYYKKYKANFKPLEFALEHADIISLHVPIIEKGIYKTKNLINKNSLKLIKKNAVLINTSRGAIINEFELLDELQTKNITLILDVFSNEPEINPKLIAATLLATPHIAGYSKLGKINSSIEIAKKFYKKFKISTEYFLDSKGLIEQKELTTQNNDFYDLASLLRIIQGIYDLCLDDRSFKKKIDSDNFIKLRKNYNLRDDFSLIKIKSNNNQLKAKLNKLGFL